MLSSSPFPIVHPAGEPRFPAAAGVLLAVLALALAVGPAFSQDLVPVRKLDRKFPTDLFCPFPETVTFTAIRTQATIEFRANTSYGATPIRQAIDALCVADAFQVATNSGPCSACTSYSDGLGGTFPVDAFRFDYFQPIGQTIAWLEQFDTDPAGRGWDLTHGATWNAARSGPRDPGSGGGDRTGGSLELFANGPCGDSLSRAKVTVSGLVPGQSYTLTGWWSCPNMVIGHTTLEIRVSDQDYTLSQTTWAHGPEMTLRLAGGGTTRYDHVVVPDGQGGGIAIWSDQRGLDLDVYAQRFLTNGTIATGWPAGGVPLCTAGGDQRYLAAVSDGSGGALVCWTDSRNGALDTGVYAQRVTSAGAIASGWPTAAAGGLAIVTSPGNQNGTRMVRTSDGAVIAWSDGRSGGYDVYAQRVTGAGAISAGWPANGVALCTAAGDPGNLRLAPDGADGAFAGWEDPRLGGSSPNEIYLQRVAASGAIASGWPAAATGGINLSNAGGNDFIGDVVTDHASGVYVNWIPLSGSAPLVTRRGATGARVAGWPAGDVATCAGCPGYHQDSQLITEAAVPGVVVVYGAGGNQGYFAQRLTTTGAVASGWPATRVTLTTAPGTKELEKVVSDGLGGAWVVWANDTGNFGPLYAQRVGVQGVIPSGWPATGRAITIGNTTQFGMATADTAGAFVAWTDGSSEVKALRIDRHGFLGDPGPTLDAIVDHAADQGGSVDLRWSAGDLHNISSFRGAGQYRFWRATEGSQPPVWSLIGTQPASDLCTRVFVATTPNIATGGTATRTRFRIEAYEPATSRSWFCSPDSAFSVDNLAPAIPAGFGGSAGGGSVSLSWTANAESDLSRYRLYRGNYAAFPIGPGTLVAEPTGTTYMGPARPYFKITALDTHGNESGVAAIGPLVAAGAPEPPAFELALAPPQPTPARGSTLLRFTLPSRSNAALSVYDVNGRRVRELARGVLPEGEHAIRWDGRDGAGNEAASGLYFVRLETAAGQRHRRLVLLP